MALEKTLEEVRRALAEKVGGAEVGLAVREAVDDLRGLLEERVGGLGADVQARLEKVEQEVRRNEDVLRRDEETLIDVEAQWGPLERLVRRCTPGKVLELEQQLEVCGGGAGAWQLAAARCTSGLRLPPPVAPQRVAVRQGCQGR